MYAIKGGWIGQTLALATCNESGGRKARIRRSKEERKTMVESFIKTYQISNDGKFPSLNLTHKEVGGSFYTVREIVRDIIQENRVLGPAKFNSDNQKLNGNTREFPNESASMESHDYLFQLENENIALLDQHTSAIVEMNMDGNEQYAKHESVDAGEFVANTAIEESDKLVYIEEAELEIAGCSENANLEIKLKSEDLDAEQLVFDSTVEECTESSISESFVVEQEAEVEVIDCSESANLEDLEAEQLVYGSTVEEDDEVVSVESSVSESFVVEQEPELEVTGCSENANLEIKLNDDEEKTKHDVLEFGKYVSGSQVEESDKIKSIEPSLMVKHEVGRNSGLIEAKTTNISPTENIVVETFPLRSVTMDINTVDTASKLNGSRGLDRDLEKLENDCRVVALDKSVNASEPVVQKEVDEPEASSSNGRPAMVYETTSKNASDLMDVKESSRSGEAADIGTHNINKPITGSHVKLVDGSEEIRGAKARDDIVFPNNSHGAKSANCIMELKGDKPVMLGGANETPKENQALKESKPTLDRMNLGSWEGASKKSLEQERNPLFIFLKSLVSAFMKFFS